MYQDKIIQAVILAGGMGLRLRPYTVDTPKPMVKVNGRPFIEYLIDFLKSNGIEEIVLCLGYLPHKVTEHLGNGSKFGVKIRYSIGAVEDYTGTRLRNAKELLADKFLLLYCDNYLPVDLARLAEFHKQNSAPATVTVYTNKDSRTKNNLFVDEDGFVVKYDRSRLDRNLNGVDMGFFILHKDIVDSMPKTNFWFEHETMTDLIAARQLNAFTVDVPYYSLSTPEKMTLLEKFLAPKKVVFVERDALLGRDEGIARDATAALSLLRERGYTTYVVGNYRADPALAAPVVEAYAETEQMLAARGLVADGVYYCHHGQGDGCECRMPKAGLLIQAARDHSLDLTASAIIVATPEAAAASKAVGITRVITRSADGAMLKNIQSQFLS